MPELPSLYLDYAATTPLDDRVLQAMLPYLGASFGNPSSLHRWGREAAKAIQGARQTIASCLGAASPESIFFTSGATEADNLAITGLAESFLDKGKHIVTSQIEHAAIDNPCRRLEKQGWEVSRLPVNSEGFIDLESLKAAIRQDTVLVSIIHGNNEIGTVQPIEVFGDFLRERGIAFHTDAVQIVGKLPFNLKEMPIDYLSLSAHKFYGPKGTGALYCRPGATLPIAQIFGGGQENGQRSGTENLPAIIGMAAALEIAIREQGGETARLHRLQGDLIQKVRETIPSAILNGPQNPEDRVPGNVHFSFPPIEGEAIVRHLDLQGIATSSGSACHSAVVEPSRIVLALGQTESVARSTVRFSLGKLTTQADIDRLMAVLPAIIERLGKRTKKSSSL